MRILNIEQGTRNVEGVNNEELATRNEKRKTFLNISISGAIHGFPLLRPAE
jgi:hypothetical protein